jgi:SAM-dependent methyltransferase
VKQQIDAFEQIIKKFSKVEVKRVLDVACGTSLQLRELARRGYEAVGLDLSSEMLEYLSVRAREEGLKVETVQADMFGFQLKKQADFAFIMMGSLAVDSDDRFLKHLDSVASSLRSGGLYFVQNFLFNWEASVGGQSWEMERDGIKVGITFKVRWKEMQDRIYAEDMVVDVGDHGKKLRLESTEDLQFIPLHEFKRLVALNGKFEFLGCWKGSESTWFLDKPLNEAESMSNLNMVLLRRK